MISNAEGELLICRELLLGRGDLERSCECDLFAARKLLAMPKSG